MGQRDSPEQVCGGATHVELARNHRNCRRKDGLVERDFVRERSQRVKGEARGQTRRAKRVAEEDKRAKTGSARLPSAQRVPDRDGRTQ